MLGGMSTDELSRTSAPTDDHPYEARTPLLRRPWVLPLALLTVIFLDQAIGVTSWFSWVVNLLIVEWWLHRRPGQRRSNRITTRGNPPETAVVSAALAKPASSKSLRVPT